MVGSVVGCVAWLCVGVSVWFVFDVDVWQSLSFNKFGIYLLTLSSLLVAAGGPDLSDDFA